MPRTPAGKYRMRIVVLTVSRTTNEANNEAIETWPDPEAGTNEYFAARETMTAGETIAQGLRQSTGGITLRIRGRRIAITTSDHIRNKVTGEEFSVTAVSRDEEDTIVSVERLIGQETGQ